MKLPLGELAFIKTGSKPKEIFDTYRDYEYINAGTTNSGYVEEFNCKGDVVTTPSRGQGGIGYIGYQSNPFWLGALCYQIRSIDNKIIQNRYLYYYLSANKDEILQYKNEGGTPSLNAIDLKSIFVVVPCIDRQEYIISILNYLDKLCSDLSNGLPAEIVARQKQYEYYRDKLLSFKELE